MIFEDNMRYVLLHNANVDLHGFTLEMNEFADLVRFLKGIIATFV